MDKEISLIEIIQKFKSVFSFIMTKWKTVIIVSVIAGIVGFLFAWFQDPKYIAEMTFVTESEQSSSLGGYANIAAQFGLDIGGGASSVFSEDNLVELLKSRILIDKTLLTSVNGNLLIDQYVLNHKLNKSWAKDTALSKISFASKLINNDYNRKRDSIFNKISDEIIKNSLDVDKVDKKLDIIYIKMSDNDMLFAKNFVEKLAGNAIKFYTRYKTEKNQENVDILQRQTDSVKETLFGNINDVASIIDLNVNPIRQSLRTSGQKRQIDLQVNSALYTELLKNLEMAKLTLRKETPLIQIIDTPKLPLKNEKKGKLLMGLIFGVIGFISVISYHILRFTLKDSNPSVS